MDFLALGISAHRLGVKASISQTNPVMLNPPPKPHKPLSPNAPPFSLTGMQLRTGRPHAQATSCSAALLLATAVRVLHQCFKGSTRVWAKGRRIHDARVVSGPFNGIRV